MSAPASLDRPAELRRAIRLPHATALVVGTIIGASIFVQPSEITARVPSVPGILAVWALAGLLTLAGALICAELASTFPESGGVYVYLREAFGRPLGFLWGWAMFWSMHSGIIAAIAVVCARYAGALVPLDDTESKLVAIGAIVLLSVVNYLGVRQGSRLQTVFTVVKVLAVVLIVALGFLLGSPHASSPLAPRPSSLPSALGPRLSALLSALAAGLFAFGGWHMVTYSAEETVEPRKTIPRALALGVGIVTIAYLAMNAVYLYTLPLETVAGSTRVAADLAEAILGPGGARLIAILVIFSAFGALAGIVLAGPRVYLAMSRDGLLFQWAGAIHPKHLTPHWAILLQAVWASVLVATGTFRDLVSRVIYTEWIFFGIMALGLMLLRRRAGLSRDYSVPGYPLLPVVFAVVAFAVAMHEVLAAPQRTLTGLGLVLLGLPVYYLWARKTPSPASR